MSFFSSLFFLFCSLLCFLFFGVGEREMVVVVLVPLALLGGAVLVLVLVGGAMLLLVLLFFTANGSRL